jgi:hypothetical protein
LYVSRKVLFLREEGNATESNLSGVALQNPRQFSPVAAFVSSRSGF